MLRHQAAQLVARPAGQRAADEDLGQALPRRLCERRVDVGQRRSAPQRQRVGRPSGFQQFGAPQVIHLKRLGDEPVTGRMMFDHQSRHGPAQPRDLRLQRVGRTGGRVGVQAADQLVVSHDPPSVEHEHRQQGALPWRRDLHAVDQHRTEHPELHRPDSSRVTRSTRPEPALLRIGRL